MSRNQIELPAKLFLNMDVTIRASNLNYGGHVGNDAILTIMQKPIYSSTGNWVSEMKLVLKITLANHFRCRDCV